jgi:hypothetical protein
MSLTIISRPQKDLYVNNPPGVYEEPYYNSRWVSAHLPVQYKIKNTKWPVNSDDDVDSICSVSNNNGLALIQLCSTYETYLALSYVKIENSSVASYNGVWQILDMVTPTSFIISASFAGTATGTVQRYYNNYHNIVKVYAGIPSYHQYESEDPMSLIAQLKIVPDGNNVSIVDISGLIQTKVNCDNDLNQISKPNDLNAWTGFYIEYTESYDESDGFRVSTFTDNFITDTAEECNIENIIQNGDFNTDLSGWTNVSSGSTFVYDSGKASATRAGNTMSSILMQQVDFIQGMPYNIQATVTINEPSLIKFTIYLFKDSFLTASIIYSNYIWGAQHISLTITPDKNYVGIGFRISSFGGNPNQKVSLDNISATALDCTYYGFAINGVRQFQNKIGGNFGDYVQNFNNEVVLNKFLTFFSEPRYFKGQYFDLSTIIPKSTFDRTDNNRLYYQVKEYDSSGNEIQRHDIELLPKDDGVYRLPVSDLSLNPDTDSFSVQIYQLPTNKFTQGNDGTFEYSDHPLGNPPSDWGLIRNSGIINGSLGRTITKFHSGGASLIMALNTGGYVPGIHFMWSTTTGITVQPNKDYILEGYVLSLCSPSYVTGKIYMLPITAGTTYTVVKAADMELFGQNWFYFKVILNTGNNTSINVGGVIEYFSATGTGGGNVWFDDVTIKGPIENLSEIKTINVDNNCSRQNIYLTWLNSLGGWEYWNFTAEKDYSEDILESTSISRDILNDWDNTFINGETQDDYIRIQSVPKVLVRSQFMTRDEVEAVKNIKTAIRVQEIRSDNSKVTVLVDKSSFRYKSDGDKLFSIEFEITYPNTIIQTQ